MALQPYNEHELLSVVMKSRQVVEAIEAELKTAKEVRDEAETKLIEYLEARDLRGFESDQLNASVKKVETLRVKIAKVEGEDEGAQNQNDDIKDKAFLYIDEELGRSDAIKVRKEIHHATLSSIIGKLFKDGKPYPKDLFSVFWQKTLQIQKKT